jgi:formate--tetrahydrofolate ligase
MAEDLLPISLIAEGIGIPEDCVVNYGRYTAKLRLELLAGPSSQSGKLILVTAMTPTAHGEGKTVVSIGLSQALARLGKKSVVTLREPSLGPVFGIKGGATGGGKSRVLPSNQINLHFNGDFHAITAAHNLLAASIDSHLHHGNELRIDVDNIFWPRTADMNDRALRHLIVGLGGKANGVPRETGFVITAASEVMAILALATSRQDLRSRLNEIVVGYDLDGKIVRAGDLGVTGALMVLLNDVVMPNLVQTTEHTPAFVHTGPFANIAHGTSSVISQLIGLRFADYVVNEAGFGADLGAEKYFDIVMPASGLAPAATVVVATIRALAHHGSSAGGEEHRRPGLVAKGASNLRKHLQNLRRFNAAAVVAINRFEDDSDEEIEIVRAACEEEAVKCAVVEAFEKGGEGTLDLAAGVIDLAADSGQPCPLYAPELSLEMKIERIASEIYGASRIHLESAARRKLARFSKLGYSHLPVCMAKTQSSLSDDPKVPGVPSNWTLTITDAHLSAGAGFVVAVAGGVQLMPGLPKSPQAFKMDVDDRGNIVGLT